MKFIKNILSDMHHGIVKHYMLFICPVVLATIVSADCVKKINVFLKFEKNVPAENSFGDIWFCIYGGMEKYIPTQDNPFKFPVIWTTLFVICALLVLIYPTKDMLGMGSHVIVAGGSRAKWWFSKVIWNISATVIYHGMVSITIMITCLVVGIRIRPGLNMNLQNSIYELDNLNEFYMKSTIPAAIFILPVLISVAMNLFQMTLTFFMNPNYSFMISCFLMIAAAYMLNPVMIYNYAMPLRYTEIYSLGIKYQYGFVAALAIGVLSVVIGYLRFLKYDIIKKEDN